MIKFARLLPGELEGNINPEDYGLGVIKAEVPSPEETARRIGEFYARVKDRTGVVIPELEPYLGAIALPDQTTEVEPL